MLYSLVNFIFSVELISCISGDGCDALSVLHFLILNTPTCLTLPTSQPPQQILYLKHMYTHSLYCHLYPWYPSVGCYKLAFILCQNCFLGRGLLIQEGQLLMDCSAQTVCLEKDKFTFYWVSLYNKTIQNYMSNNKKEQYRVYVFILYNKINHFIGKENPVA